VYESRIKLLTAVQLKQKLNGVSKGEIIELLCGCIPKNIYG